MPRLTLIPQSSFCPPSCPNRSVREIINELRAAGAGMADGPEILWLVNELMQACEDRFATEAGGPDAETGARRQDFLTRLTRFAEDIRQENGALSDGFIAFLATAPIGPCEHDAA